MKNNKEYEAVTLAHNYVRNQIKAPEMTWEIVKKVRNINRRLYPLNWEYIITNWETIEKNRRWYKGEPIPPLEFKSKKEFEAKLKLFFDALYDWELYEECPVCRKGIKVPQWAFGGWTPFCGCSNYPKCLFAIDRGGEPILAYKEMLEQREKYGIKNV